MPFDALAMRAIEVRWQRDLVGCTCVRITQQGKGRLLWSLQGPQGPCTVLLVLTPGLQRIHRSTKTSLDKRRPMPWLDQLTPFAIRSITVPPFERVMQIGIEKTNDWGISEASTLIVELAGHLTNLIHHNAEGLVNDALRKIAPGRPGRTIWPKMPYEMPPQVANPLDTHNPKDLPPWARRWLQQGGTWDRLLSDWRQGFPGSGWLLRTPESSEAWVYPVPGFETKAASSFEEALDQAFYDREKTLAQEQWQKRLESRLTSRLTHLQEKLAEYQEALADTGELHRQRGDLWLTWQSAFHESPALSELSVKDYQDQMVTLSLKPGQTPAEAAASCYRLYKKAKARHQALMRLIPLAEDEMRHLEALKAQALNPHPILWYREHVKSSAPGRAATPDHTPFRRYQSSSGFDLYVGKNREENASLTFQKARPDDLWFHAKQSPGSHVILFTGKKNANLEDLLDAAQLAVFFSSAHDSSAVPVDYTKRKFVRKRPHAEPGQVLYQREKTLYITPDRDRLRRLGAVKDKLVDD